MSVYDRMNKDEKLFWLCYGALYVTEMRRVKGVGSTGLKIKSKGLAETWFKLCKKYGVLSNKDTSLRVKGGVYSFGCSANSLYRLLKVVKRLPENQMDLQVRERIGKLIYTEGSVSNKNRIKILKILRKRPLTTNALARAIGFSPGNKFKEHLACLQQRGLLKREKVGKQSVVNILTIKGSDFIEAFVKEIEKQPTNSFYNQCFQDKQLAADLFLVTCELEMGGIIQRQPYLQMKSKDYVEFIRRVSKRWGWTHYDKCVKIDRENWSTTYLVSLNSKAFKEIYALAGPCADDQKDCYFKHGFSLRNPGQHGKLGETNKQILDLVENGIHTSNELALDLNVGIQNIQRNLLKLVKTNKLKRVWKERSYCYVRC